MFNERRMTIDVRRSQMQPEYSFVRATNNFLLRKHLFLKIFFSFVNQKSRGTQKPDIKQATLQADFDFCILVVLPSCAPMQRHNNGEGCHRCLVFSDAFCTALYISFIIFSDKKKISGERIFWVNFCSYRSPYINAASFQSPSPREWKVIKGKLWKFPQIFFRQESIFARSHVLAKVRKC